jgi:hypothetical protein
VPVRRPGRSAPGRRPTLAEHLVEEREAREEEKKWSLDRAAGWEQIRQRCQGRKEIEEKDEQVSPRTFA